MTLHYCELSNFVVSVYS